MILDEAGFQLHAWVDESVHDDPGLYVLAAAVADPAACEGHRDILRSHVRRPRQRLHWSREERRDRQRVAESIGGLHLAHVVAIASPLTPKKTERARRKCLQQLLLHLAGDGVSTVWLESRGPQDRRDQALVAAMRSEGALLGPLRVEFALPLEEPMLWIPDAVAGAVAAAHKGIDASYREALGPGLIELVIGL